MWVDALLLMVCKRDIQCRILRRDAFMDRSSQGPELVDKFTVFHWYDIVLCDKTLGMLCRPWEHGERIFVNAAANFFPYSRVSQPSQVRFYINISLLYTLP